MGNSIGLPAQMAEDQLPATYQRAKFALAECVQVDECKEWADKAMALSAYAKQANDDALLNMSNRIKARAVQRMGELFNQIEPQSRSGLNQHSQGGAPLSGREQAARDADVSQDQRKQAQRIANIPADEFEKLVESDNPPTLTALAARAQSNPAAMRATSSLLGEAKRFANFCGEHDPSELATVLAAHERASMLSHAETIIRWLSRLAREIQ